MNADACARRHVHHLILCAPASAAPRVVRIVYSILNLYLHERTSDGASSSRAMNVDDPTVFRYPSAASLACSFFSLVRGKG